MVIGEVSSNQLLVWGFFVTDESAARLNAAKIRQPTRSPDARHQLQMTEFQAASLIYLALVIIV